MPNAILTAALFLATSLVSSPPPPAGGRELDPPPSYDVVIRNGIVYDGTGAPGRRADVAIAGDRVVAVGDLSFARGRSEIDAAGQAVAPGFVNMLSWSTESLLADGNGESEIRQGVTLQVMGEGWSMGPLNDTMKQEMREQQGDIRFDITWTSLGEYLQTLERRGIAPNVASFVGAATVRIHTLGHADRAPNEGELEAMRALVRQAMEEGALGVGSSLIYAPGTYAETPELIALCRAAAAYGGSYISHLRSEGDRLLEAIDELVTIAREANVPAEIYHLKIAGENNWPKLDAALARIEAARAAGLRITADMYTYPAGATGLDAAMPPWVQEGGLARWRERLRDPAVRERVRKEMATPAGDWENLLLAAGTPERVILVAFKNEGLKPLTGKTLAEVARLRGQSVEDTAMDLVIEDDSRVGAVYFLMSEENIERQLQRPWVSFGSDESAQTPAGPFLASNPHPRAYGTFARLLGHYVRERQVMPLTEAIRRLTSLPADNLGLRNRGRLAPGFHADVVVFDPATITDHATFDRPHQFATGVSHVLVNGVAVLAGGELTGAKPGRVVRGPGWTGR